MRTHLKTVLGIAAVLTLCASSASAVTMVATITGVTSDYDDFNIDHGYDTTGEFGLNDLGGGLAFTATFTYNTNVGVRTQNLPYSDELTNSAAFPDVVSATITINGITETIAGNNTEYGYGDEAFVYGRAERTQYNATDYFTVNGIRTDNNLFFEPVDYSIPELLTQTLAKTPTRTDPTNNVLTISVINGNNQVLHNAEVFLDSRTLMISMVPEPSTWAMLLLGFGGIGAMLRLGRGKNAQTA